MSEKIPGSEEVQKTSDDLRKLRDSLSRVIYGQEQLLEVVTIGLLAGGHLLLEGLPGLGKTELIKALAQTLALQVKRVQFTPDLLPGDITGSPILEQQNGKPAFVFHRGPLFTNLLLADEINRASPKTQSALLEAMQERRVTVMGESHPLPLPFFVLATQNPIELEGTYPLPEAQLDRFLFKLEVRRTDAKVLQRIVSERRFGVDIKLEVALDAAQLSNAMQLTQQIYLHDSVANYIARLVTATHRGESVASEAVSFGASPRAALGFAAAARARALIQGRTHASFEDVQAVAHPILCHRIILDYSAKVKGVTSHSVVAALLEEIPTLDKEIPSTMERR